MIRGIEKRNIVDKRKDREDFISRIVDIASDTQTIIYASADIVDKSCPYPIAKRSPQPFQVYEEISYRLRYLV
jgi:hypothetical protein